VTHGILSDNHGMGGMFAILNVHSLGIYSAAHQMPAQKLGGPRVVMNSRRKIRLLAVLGNDSEDRIG
jgi:hypothetical protein